MNVIRDAARPGETAPVTLVMLPPAYSAPEDFVREGFVSAVRARALPIDLAFAALELEHATDRALLERLRQEIVRPARAQRAAVWLGGLSLGGYLSLCYAARDASELAGVCVFAPYLGSHLITAEIERAGGVSAWRAGDAADEDEERRVWRFIQGLRAGPLAVHLGLGREDRFAPRHRLMVPALPAAAVDTVPGGHDWPTWRKLWENFLHARFAHSRGA